MPWLTLKFLALALVAFTATWLAPAPSSAQVAWRFATEYPESNISGVGLTTFARLVSLRTNASVTIANTFDDQLKIGSAKMFQAVEDRRITGGDAFAGPLEASDALFGLASLPFAVQSVDAAKAANGRARPLYERALARRGMRLLYITIWPSTGLWSSRPIASADDLRTLAVRTYDNNSAQVLRSAGATAEYLSFNEAVAKVNGRARPLYERALARRGMRLLYITIWPSTGLWSSRPIASADDLRTLAVRTYDNNSAQVLRSAGATAEYLSFNEAVAKVKSHQLNAILTSGDGGAGRKLWDDLAYFTPINYAIPISIAFVSAEAFEALPKQVQDEVLQAAAETEASQFELLATRTTENYARMRENGVTIADPAPAAVIAALKKGAEAPIALWKTKVPVEAAGIVDWVLRQN